MDSDEDSSWSAAIAKKEEGNVRFKAKDYAGATLLYTNAVELSPDLTNPKVAPFYGNRAACHVQQYKWEEAITDCTKALDVRPDGYLKVRLRRAMAYEQMNQLEKSLEDFKACVASDARNKEASVGLARLETRVSGVEKYTWDAKLTLDDGMSLDYFLALARYQYNERYAAPEHRIVGYTNDFEGFMHLPRSHPKLGVLNAIMYTLWHCGFEGIAGTGVYHLAQETFELNGETEDEKLKIKDALKASKTWPLSRIFGKFFVHSVEDEGTIMVSENLKKVYLVLGMGDSVWSCCLPANPPVMIECTVLPWANKLVYDGICKVYPMKLPQNLLSQLDKVVKNAKEKNKVIKSLNLDDRKYFKVEEEGQVADSACEEDDPELTEAEERQRELLTSVKKNTLSTIFRRMGYTKAENPNKLLTAMTVQPNGMMVQPGMIQMRGYEPTPKEILRYLENLINENSRNPQFSLSKDMGIDGLAAFKRVKKVLGGTGIHCFYYPPPSAQEQRLYSSAY
eukprot:m.131002 g.131002  ORF g.131002 m.131002 type:complete len:509 (+) comp29515_c0_seq6:126-1652(+)